MFVNHLMAPNIKTHNLKTIINYKNLRRNIIQIFILDKSLVVIKEIILLL